MNCLTKQAAGEGVLKKLCIVGIIIILLQVPASMIDAVIASRGDSRDEAVNEMKKLFGFEQIVSSPVLRLPYEVTRDVVVGSQDKHYTPENQRRTTETVKGAFYSIPRSLHISANSTHEARRRGIFEMPVFRTKVEQAGSFDLSTISAQLPKGATPDWSKAEILLDVQTRRALVDAVSLTLEDRPVTMTTRLDPLPGFQRPVSATLPAHAALELTPLHFRVSYSLQGTDSLMFRTPAAESTISLRSTWPSPSFIGDTAPVDLRQDALGLSAAWREGTDLSGWIEGSENELSTLHSAGGFGARFITPVDTYRMTHRAGKYEFLFVVLVFSSFYIFEVMSALRIHPIQYALVGAALVLFFLLLISLSEHIFFEAAYGIATGAATALVTGYSRSMLGAASKAWMVCGMMLSLYGFLFVVLQSQDYALILGASGLTLQLAFLMYLTRNIDWYAGQKTADAQLRKQSCVSIEEK